MGYFADNYSNLTLPFGEPGFREAQLAAIHAISAHFFATKAPAIVVMPTGAGKTAVAAAVCFNLRPSRVLVITPSRLLREQIAEKFETLVDLERIRAIPALMERPRVLNLRNRVKSIEDWANLREFDVVVSTVYGVSGLDGKVPDIPPDLFDLVIVDEAHHAPAATWARALEHLSSARQILLTATPFRRDARQIPGRIVFTYDVKRAYEDGVFGDLTFRPANPGDGANIDEAIAREAEAQFLEDRANGLEHLVMVRVDGIDRGHELEAVYRKTSLRLKFVSGRSSLSTVKKVNAELRKGELDGIICVNMFGEGFDLPRLKIAALHSPHKSLAVTLQFIGRFARTTDKKIGRATFVAFPEEQRAEIQELWTTSAIWPEIVHNISTIRIERERLAQEVYDTFDQPFAPEIGDLPLNLIRPYFHAKIFHASNDVDLNRRPVPQKHRRLAFSTFSPEVSTLVLIEQYVAQPKWLCETKFEDGLYHLSILHWNKKRGYIFIGATDKSVSNYDRLLSLIGESGARELSSARINRALNGIDGLTFFNLGMRRKQFGGRAESYRILAGPSADIIISELDGQSYNRGHSFGKGRRNGVDVTIGISTSSKIWSNFVGQIPDYVDWCADLAERLSSKNADPTGSGLDRLSAGQPITKFPTNPVLGFFNPQSYISVPRVFRDQELGGELGLITDFDISVLGSSESEAHFRVSSADLSWDAVLRLGAYPPVVPFDECEVEPFVGRVDEAIALSEYLSEYVPLLLLENFDVVEHGSVFESTKEGVELDRSCMQTIDWAADEVNIEIEKPPGHAIKAKSIFSWMEDYLDQKSCKFVFNDDGAGEVADFITLESFEDENWISLYHCKASGEDTAGSRLDDLYDVCGQAIRSGIWLPARRLVEQLQHRMTRPSIVGVRRGNFEQFRTVFVTNERQKLRFANIIVQPGLSSAALRERPEQLLVTTKHSVLAAGFDRFEIICSN